MDVVILREGSKIPSANTFLSEKELAGMGSVTLATASLRRQSLLKSASKAINLKPIRGNVDTRIKKLHESDWDGIVLAKAALDRLELSDLRTRVLRFKLVHSLPPLRGLLPSNASKITLLEKSSICPRSQRQPQGCHDGEKSLRGAGWRLHHADWLLH